jgi:peptidoglycan/xylan/chitin deacetylase (PgdA/CDA1 family)
MSLKRTIYLASYYGGADRLARLASPTRGAIVMFHRVLDRDPTGDFQPNRELAVTQAVLRSIIRGLRAAGFEIIPLDAVAGRIKTSNAPPFACLTFDDGYRDNLTLALPVCAEMKAPMTVYLTTGFMDRTATIWWLDLEALVASQPTITMTLSGEERTFETSTSKEKIKAYGEIAHHFERATISERESCLNQMAERYGIDGQANTRALTLSWDEARQLAQHPLVTIGAHTVSHPTLASLDQEQARREMAESRARIETELKRPVAHFAYPYGGQGNATEREFSLAKELGYETAVTTRFGVIQNGKEPQLHALPRVTSNSFDDERTVRVKLSGLPALLSSH